MKGFKPIVAVVSATVVLTASAPGQTETTVTEAQGRTDVDMTLSPNAAAKALMVPSGWGAWGHTLFLGAGLTYPQVYADDADGGATIGYGFGHPAKNLGVQLTASVLDISEFDNFAFGAKIHRYLGYGLSVAIGGDGLGQIHDNDDDDDVEPTGYIAISRSSQRLKSLADPKVSRLHVNIGAGTERFARKSERDRAEGKGKYGTVAFGSIAYELWRNINLIVDWNGINLSAGVSVKPFTKVPVGLSLGAADLTTNSGDGVRFIASVGGAIDF